MVNLIRNGDTLQVFGIPHPLFTPPPVVWNFMFYQDQVIKLNIHVGQHKLC